MADMLLTRQSVAEETLKSLKECPKRLAHEAIEETFYWRLPAVILGYPGESLFEALKKSRATAGKHPNTMGVLSEGLVDAAHKYVGRYPDQGRRQNGSDLATPPGRVEIKFTARPGLTVSVCLRATQHAPVRKGGAKYLDIVKADPTKETLEFFRLEMQRVRRYLNRTQKGVHLDKMVLEFSLDDARQMQALGLTGKTGKLNEYLASIKNSK